MFFLDPECVHVNTCMHVFSPLVAKASFLVDADNVGGAEVASMASMIKADDSVSEISPVKCVGVDEVINTVLRACESMTREEFFLTYSTLGSPTSSSISATAGDSISTSSNSSMTEACTVNDLIHMMDQALLDWKPSTLNPELPYGWPWFDSQVTHHVLSLNPVSPSLLNAKETLHAPAMHETTR